MKKKYKICLAVAMIAVFLAKFTFAASAFDASSEKICCICEQNSRDFDKNNEILGICSTLLKNQVVNRNKSTTDYESDLQVLPEEYDDFIGSLPDTVIDKLPDGAFSSEAASLETAARDVSGISYLLGALIEAFGGALGELLPTLLLLCGIVVLSAACHTFASGVGAGLGGAVSFATRLCSFCAIAAVSTSAIERLEGYFDGLLSSVGAFLPLSAVLYAMGGNLSGAASGTATLSATLSLCELFLTKTVIPVFCFCLSLTLLQAFDGQGAFSGQSVAATVKKWYTTALAFVMMILTASISAQNVLSAKADGAAMRGVKFAASSFIPISGGALSSTLGTLAASVELIRGSVGAVGVAVIFLMLIPVIVELALLRGIFALTAFMAGLMGCGGEQRLLSEIGSLYGYLEGIAALSAAVFVIAFGVFASTAAAV
jgi:stage III sporulation protein AE